MGGPLVGDIRCAVGVWDEILLLLLLLLACVVGVSGWECKCGSEGVCFEDSGRAGACPEGADTIATALSLLVAPGLG